MALFLYGFVAGIVFACVGVVVWFYRNDPAEISHREARRRALSS